MCVIIVVEEGANDVTNDEWVRASEVHDDGYGIAWFDQGTVRYIKRTEQAEDLIDFRPPKPYVMHFRQATQGDAVTRLCHPFPIARHSPLRKKGKAKQVLFHNGHYSKWQDLLLQLQGKIPSGPYSDSRVIAMAVHQFGPTLLDLPGFVHERFCIMDGERYNLELFGGWEFDEDDKIWRSNTWHQYTTWYDHGDCHRHDPSVCMEGACTEPVCEDSYIYCKAHKQMHILQDKALDTWKKERAVTEWKYCRACRSELCQDTSKKTGYCVSCRDQRCVQCGMLLGTDDIRNREAYCKQCREHLVFLHCTECGVQLSPDCPYSKCDHCFVTEGKPDGCTITKLR